MPRIVEVEWVDASSGDSWLFDRDLEDSEVLCKSYGVIVGETKQVITVAGTVGQIDGDGRQSACRMTIPRVSIRKIRTVRK